MKVRIGNSTIGYDSVEVKSVNGKYRVDGEFYGRKTILKKAIANLNRGESSIWIGNDEFPVTVVK